MHKISTQMESNKTNNHTMDATVVHYSHYCKMDIPICFLGMRMAWSKHSGLKLLKTDWKLQEFLQNQENSHAYF